MVEIKENYNNSKEGNDMRTQMDKFDAAQKQFIVLTHEELDMLFAVASNGSANLESADERKLAEGRVIELKHLFETNLYTKDEALNKINGSDE